MVWSAIPTLELGAGGSTAAPNALQTRRCISSMVSSIVAQPRNDQGFSPTAAPRTYRRRTRSPGRLRRLVVARGDRDALALRHSSDWATGRVERVAGPDHEIG